MHSSRQSIVTNYTIFFFFLWCFDPILGHGLLIQGFVITLLGHTTLGGTPLDELSAPCRELYLTTHNIHKRQTSMLPVGFKLTIPASEHPQTYAFHCGVTGISYTESYCFNFSERIHLKKPVVQIQYMDDGVMVKTLDGTIFNGLYVILAIPPPANVSSEIKFTQPRVLSEY